MQDAINVLKYFVSLFLVSMAFVFLWN